MKKIKNTLSISIVTSLLSCILAYGSTPSEANVYYTSFESNEEPGYITGNLSGQNGWSAGNQGGQRVVITGGGVNPVAPNGLQLVSLDGTDLWQNLKFTDEALTERLYFSIASSISGTVTEDGLLTRLYLNNTSNGFHGAAFGIHREDGKLRFYTQFKDGSNNGSTRYTFGDVEASLDTFYRFEVDMDISGKSYLIRVYDFESGDLLAASADGGFRGDLSINIDYLRLNTSTNSANDITAYFDQVAISTTPIPEPSSLALLVGSGVLLFILAKRRRSFSS